MIFGTFVPQGWKMELAGIPDPEQKWAVTVEVAELADELGYDSIWVYDHFHNVPVPAHETMFECWTTLAALSQRTSRVRLGQMVSCALYRNPGMIAKITSNIDVISGGRLDWGIGAGWYDGEFKAYGYDYPSNADRIRMLRETVEIVKLMWSEADAHYEGRHFTIAGAQCDPKPLQDPHPPIWIGGGGEQLTLRVVARHATHSNFGGKPDEWAHKADVLRGHCEGHRPRSVRDHDDVVARALRPGDRGRGGHRVEELLGRAVRVVARRQPRGHTRADLREARRVSGARLWRRRALGRGLPVDRVGAAVRGEGDPRAPLSAGHSKKRTIVSATHEGLGAPSTSNV